MAAGQKAMKVPYYLPSMYSPTKTNVGSKWYQSISLPLTLNHRYFIFKFEGTPSLKLNKPVSAFNDHKN
jgi:hypothetical protein